MAGLAFNIDPAGRLLVIPTGRRRVASLRLTEAGADVLYPELRPVRLPWDAYGMFARTTDGPLHDGWFITGFVTHRAIEYGMALRVSGAYDLACHAIFAETATRRRRLAHWLEDDLRAGHRLSVMPTYAFLFPFLTSERATLAALATVLARRPELRHALSEPQRVARLAADLAAGMQPAPPTRTGGRRDTVDILYAMHAAGVYHQFGRPLPGESRPTIAEIVALIHARLSASPYWKGRPIPDDRIAKLARTQYLDVKPWPFAALLR